jgi:hypothetical protein
MVAPLVRAVEDTRTPEPAADQLDDLILLLSLVENPDSMRAEAMGGKLAEMLRQVAERIGGRARDDDRSLDALGVPAVLTDP